MCDSLGLLLRTLEGTPLHHILQPLVPQSIHVHARLILAGAPCAPIGAT